MKKKEYEKPMIRIIDLHHQVHLLQASGQAGTQDYNVNDYYEQ